MEQNQTLNKKIVIKNLNLLLKEAVIHGGDVGGPYGGNTAHLLDAIQLLMNSLKVDNYCVKMKDEMFPVILLPGEVEVKEPDTFCF